LTTSIGVAVRTTADFAQGEDQTALVTFGNVLQQAPETVFPVALFGQVTVLNVKVRKVLGSGAWAGIGVGIAVASGVVVSGLAMVVCMIQRRRRLNQAVADAARKSSILRHQMHQFEAFGEVDAFSASEFVGASNIQPGRPSAAASDSSDEGTTLRELYAVKQALGRHSSVGSMHGEVPSPRLKDALTLFDNPLAGEMEIEEGMIGAYGGPDRVLTRKNSRCNSPPPAVLAGWFTEAREKFAEKRKQTAENRVEEEDEEEASVERM